MSLDITPDTKVGALLDRWPELEAVLVELSPHFRALRNPLLRRTVARIATLRQAASVGGVPLHDLLDRLRAAAGLPPSSLPVEPEEGGARTVPPEWANEREAAQTHDARPSIAAGEQPLPRVMADLARLEEGKVYQLVTPFVPAPLVELARGKGFDAFSVAVEEGLVRTFFRRSGPPGAPGG